MEARSQLRHRPTYESGNDYCFYDSSRFMIFAQLPCHVKLN